MSMSAVFCMLDPGVLIEAASSPVVFIFWSVAASIAYFPARIISGLVSSVVSHIERISELVSSIISEISESVRRVAILDLT